MTSQYEIDSRKLQAEFGMVWLAEVEVPASPLQRIRATSNNEPLTFGSAIDGTPNIYQPFPMKIGVISRTKEGDLPTIQVGVGNARWSLMTYLEAHDGLVGQPASVRLVSLGELNNRSAALQFDGEVVSTDVDVEAVVFSVGAYNAKQIQFPKNRFVGGHCRWAFGGPECGYNTNHPLASFTTCPKTFAACQERGDDEEDVMGVVRRHPERWGAWRAIPLA
jgi:phage-related protein